MARAKGQYLSLPAVDAICDSEWPSSGRDALSLFSGLETCHL